MRALIVVGILTWAVATAVIAGSNTPAPHRAGETVQSQPADQSAAAPEAFTRVCGRCHAQDRIVEGRRSRSQWEEVLERMIAKGATGSDDDFGIVMEHLVSEFGRVAINSAPADEVAHVLHLDATHADAIVSYRKTHGPFADFDALIAIPGAPVEALRKRRDAIVF
jgi:competence ComEA-like helix-hairpin-helix protein